MPIRQNASPMHIENNVVRSGEEHQISLMQKSVGCGSQASENPSQKQPGNRSSGSNTAKENIGLNSSSLGTGNNISNGVGVQVHTTDVSGTR